MTEFGWPPLLITAVAARYCQTSKSTLLRAVAAGEVQPAGRRGRSFVFSRTELDRWMTQPLESPPVAASTPARSGEPPSDLLDRLRRIRTGG